MNLIEEYSGLINDINGNSVYVSLYRDSKSYSAILNSSCFTPRLTPLDKDKTFLAILEETENTSRWTCIVDETDWTEINRMMPTWEDEYKNFEGSGL
mgnify:CR=1 FL=1